MSRIRTLLADLPHSILTWMELLVASAGVCLVLAGIPWFGEAVRDLSGNQFGVRQLVLGVTCTFAGFAGGVSAGLAPTTGWSTRPASAVHAFRTLTVVSAALFSILSATGFVPSPVVSIAALAGLGLPSLSAGRISGAKAIMTVPLAFLFAWPFLLLSALPPPRPAGWPAVRRIGASDFPTSRRWPPAPTWSWPPAMGACGG
jgi:hypothetical protein